MCGHWIDLSTGHHDTKYNFCNLVIELISNQSTTECSFKECVPLLLCWFMQTCSGCLSGLASN